MAAAATGGSIAVSSFLSSSNFSHNVTTKSPPSTLSSLMLCKCKCKSIYASGRNLACFAVQESSAAVAAETKEKKEEKEKEEEKTAEKPAPAAKKKPAAKAAAKSLPQMMEEEVIPQLRTILEAQQDITDLQLSFQDNKLEGSFLKKEYPYSFWALFPDGVLTGPKGFCLSSYGTEVSTVEPFLIDEKKITAAHVIFWVEKRLAAQGILPVWQE
ncbi:hypothetical protein M9H77_01074 [Catharanthus roseus]|uniref:Uncharacterized protein n=1 Tax=Catharanthus roseus TaxID=4058 RepID=A0ACC0C4R0_CATRO|nr:hypothetical protein M9H77_01074 [Catharanthus roseus]